MRRPLVLLLVLTAAAHGDVFSSTAHLSGLLDVERGLVSQLLGYVADTEARLSHIKTFLQDYWDMESQVEESEQVLNPLMAFHLVKRLTLDWAAMKQLLATDKLKAGLGQASQYLPGTEDLHGAAQALVRLQDTYNLNRTEMASGSLQGVHSYLGLSARDCLFLGKHAYSEGLVDRAVQWLEEALGRAHAEGNTTATPEEILPFLNTAYRVKETRQLETAESNDPYAADYQRYKALCRGDVAPEQQTRLRCYLSSHHPLLVLTPARVEEVNLEPRILIFHNVLSEKETDGFIRLARPLLSRSMVQSREQLEDQVSTVRTSQNAWLTPEMSPLMLSRVAQRVSALTGLSIDPKNDHSELPQVANYGIGGHYVPHFDYLILDKTPAERALMREKDLLAGDRIGTFMFYLSDVSRGGATVFPRLGAGVWPEKGSAVFWHNLLRNGKEDPRTLHGACPVLHGTKWVANYWIREKGQSFRRPCTLNPSL